MLTTHLAAPDTCQFAALAGILSIPLDGLIMLIAGLVQVLTFGDISSVPLPGFYWVSHHCRGPVCLTKRCISYDAAPADSFHRLWRFYGGTIDVLTLWSSESARAPGTSRRRSRREQWATWPAPSSCRPPKASDSSK